MSKKIRVGKHKEEVSQEEVSSEETPSQEEQESPKEQPITVGTLNQAEYLSALENRKIIDLLEQVVDLLKKNGQALNNIGQLMEDDDSDKD